MVKGFCCGGRKFEPFNSVFVIAELGTAHGGSFEKALELIDASVDSGADAVKFQIVYAKEILHPNTGIVNLPSGAIPLYEQFRSLEVALSFFEGLKEYCCKKNILFMASPFGRRSCQELIGLSPCCIKIASPELNYTQLLEQAAKSGLPLVLSAGVSKLKDIEHALETISSTLSQASEKLESQVALLHCITSYPAPEEEYNLSLLEVFSSLFDVAVGISDHSLNEFLVPMLSVACGACVVEKHFCLSNEDSGLDDKIALNPRRFSKMVKGIRSCEKKTKDEIIERVLGLGFSFERIFSVLGNGKKELAKSESENYKRTNRSLHYMSDFSKGYVLSEGDLGILRTEKVLSVGEAPRDIGYFVGSVLQKNVKAGDGALFQDIITRRSDA